MSDRTDKDKKCYLKIKGKFCDKSVSSEEKVTIIFMNLITGP